MADAVNKPKNELDHRSIDVNPFKILEFVLDPEQQKRSKVELIAMHLVEKPLDEETRQKLKDALDLGGVYFIGERKDELKRVNPISHFFTDYNKLKSEEEYIRKKYPEKDLKTYFAFI
ncbi:MAG: hypothetical protein KJ767_02820 [Nanoarchaeota archaeon]|nr:hypothetical protein [Nanoarchaeota archaeon]